jgi:hypothetical protein
MTTARTTKLALLALAVLGLTASAAKIGARL